MRIIRKGFVHKAGNGAFDYAGWPSVNKLPDGRLAAVFSGNRMHHVCPFGRSVICYSEDNGLTWSKQLPVVNTAFDDRDAGITVRGNQVLVTSFNNNFAFQRRDCNWKDEKNKGLINAYIDFMEDVADENDVCSSISVSEDGGKSFPVRYPMPITCPHGPIVLKDGRYFYVGREFGINPLDRKGNREYNFLPCGIYYAFSEDGYKWTEPKAIPLPEDLSPGYTCEPHAIQLKNGEVMVHIRIQGPAGSSFAGLRTFQTISSNGITEWSTAKDLGIKGSPPHLLRHSSGAIICVTGRRDAPYAEQAMVSYDEGQTWSEPFAIDPDPENGDMGYPCSVELDNGTILTVYYQHDNKGEKNSIMYTIWEL